MGILPFHEIRTFLTFSLKSEKSALWGEKCWHVNNHFIWAGGLELRGDLLIVMATCLRHRMFDIAGQFDRNALFPSQRTLSQRNALFPSQHTLPITAHFFPNSVSLEGSNGGKKGTQ